MIKKLKSTYITKVGKTEITDIAKMVNKEDAEKLLRDGSIIELLLNDGDRLLVWWSNDYEQYLGVLYDDYNAGYEADDFSLRYPKNHNVSEYHSFVKYLENRDVDRDYMDELQEDGWWKFFSKHDHLEVHQQLIIENVVTTSKQLDELKV